MGLKFLYYIDTSSNWTLFTLGIIAVPFGIGGMLLTSPIRHKNIYPPWYHATGIWVGMVFLSISMMMPFARFNPTFLRVAVFLTFLAMVVSSIGLGVGIDEFTSWFENPTVKTFGSDISTEDSNVYVANSAKSVVQNFADFDMFHKTRVISVMSCTLLGICMLMFRIVTLGLVIFDEFTTRGYDVFTPEEDMMYQAMAEREMGGGEDAEKQDYEPGFQPILYSSGKPEMEISELPDLREWEPDYDVYRKSISGIKEIGDKAYNLDASQTKSAEIPKGVRSPKFGYSQMTGVQEGAALLKDFQHDDDKEEAAKQTTFILRKGQKR